MNDIAFTCVGGFTVRNSIAVTPDGHLHALVRRCTDVTAVSAPVQQAWSARAWSKPQRLGSSYYNAIAADSKGVLHAFYNEAVIGTEEGNRLLSEIFYRRSTDGGQTWTVRANLAQLPGGDERIQVKVDGRDRLHVVWDHGSDWYLGLDRPARRGLPSFRRWRRDLARSGVLQYRRGTRRANDPGARRGRSHRGLPQRQWHGYVLPAFT